MKSILFILIMFVLIVGCSNTHTIEGFVLDNETNEPVENINVTVVVTYDAGIFQIIFWDYVDYHFYSNVTDSSGYFKVQYEELIPIPTGKPQAYVTTQWPNNMSSTHERYYESVYLDDNLTLRINKRKEINITLPPPLFCETDSDCMETRSICNGCTCFVPIYELYPGRNEQGFIQDSCAETCSMVGIDRDCSPNGWCATQCPDLTASCVNQTCTLDNS